MNKRIYWIDWLKVFTMILVVYAHACSNMVVTMIYSFHMPLFFLISGFLHKPRAFKDELKVTIKSLFIPYFILTFFFLAIHLDVNYKDYLFTSLCKLEQTPFYIRPMWFVFSLAIMRIVVSLLRTLNNCIVLSLFCILAFSVGYKLKVIPYDIDLFQLNTTLLSFPFFILGKYIAQKDVLSKFNKLPLWLIWIICLPVLCLALKNGPVNIFRCQCGRFLLLFYFNAVFLSLATFITFARIKAINQYNYYIEMTSKSMIILLAYQFTAISLLKIVIDSNTIIGSIVVTALVMIIGFFISQFCWKRLPILFGKNR